MPASAAAFGIAIVRTDLAAVWHPRWVAPRADVASGGNVRSLCVVVVHVSGWLAPTCLCLHVSFSPDHGSSNAGSSRSSPQLRWQLYQQLQPSPSAAVVVSRRRFPLVAQHVRRNPVDHVSVLAVAAASIGRSVVWVGGSVHLHVGGWPAVHMSWHRCPQRSCAAWCCSQVLAPVVVLPPAARCHPMSNHTTISHPPCGTTGATWRCAGQRRVRDPHPLPPRPPRSSRSVSRGGSGSPVVPHPACRRLPSLLLLMGVSTQ